ncbi:hypothetical protein DM01DRAFT_1333362 [Hesseltinella vesiculosa]|uniref:RNI-like protein n=1 Tax=Hesseltinella vesiculosa TaxID=101127 RepID=A0A1X2GPI9_9FUNG|nr:hypothetical protein DM01DRAFT_1333362 [Hesseltinella vesiculosa]
MHSQATPLLYRYITLNDARQFQNFVATRSPPTDRSIQSQGCATKSLRLCYSDPTTNTQSLDIIGMAFPSLTSLAFYVNSWAPPQNCCSSHAAADITNDCSTQLPRKFTSIANDLFMTFPEGPIDTCDIEALFYSGLFITIHRNHPHLRALEIDLTGTIDLEYTHLQSCFQFLPTGLVELTLYLVNWQLSFDHVECIHKHCPRLEILAISMSDLLEDEIAIHELPAFDRNHVLKKLFINAGGNPASSWRWFWYVGKKYGQQLEHLSLSSWNAWTPERRPLVESKQLLDTYVCTFAEQHAASLLSLEVENLAIYDGLWQHLKLQSEVSSLINVHMTSDDDLLFCEEETTIGSLDSLQVCLLMLDYVKPLIREMKLQVLDDVGEGMVQIYNAIGQCTHLTSLSLLRNENTSPTIHLPYLLDQCPQLRSLSLKYAGLDDTFKWPGHHNLVSLTLWQIDLESRQLNKAFGVLHSLRDLAMVNCIVLPDRGSPRLGHRTPVIGFTFLNPDMSISFANVRHQGCRMACYLTLESRVAEPSYYWLEGDINEPMVHLEHHFDTPDPQSDRPKNDTTFLQGEKSHFILILTQHYPLRHLKLNGRVIIRRGVLILN